MKPTAEVTKRTEKLLLKMNEAIKAKNAKFNDMPKLKQRRALAREVLSLIRGNRVTATRGVYLRGGFTAKAKKGLPPTNFDEFLKGPKDRIDWQMLLPQVRQCQVCNLGIAVFASIRLRDGLQYDPFTDLLGDRVNFRRNQCQNILADLFTNAELYDMEYFFEYKSVDVSARKAVEIFWRSILRCKGNYDNNRLQTDLNKEVRRQHLAKVTGRNRS